MAAEVRNDSPQTGSSYSGRGITGVLMPVWTMARAQSVQGKYVDTIVAPSVARPRRAAPKDRGALGMLQPDEAVLAGRALGKRFDARWEGVSAGDLGTRRDQHRADLADLVRALGGGGDRPLEQRVVMVHAVFSQAMG
jgi:hypothetical protein